MVLLIAMQACDSDAGCESVLAVGAPLDFKVLLTLTGNAQQGPWPQSLQLSVRLSVTPVCS